jgi:hypothetical protein
MQQTKQDFAVDLPQPRRSVIRHKKAADPHRIGGE